MSVPDLQDALDRLQREDVDGAIATLQRKVEELPAHLTAYVLLARAHESKHQWRQALESWENVYFLMPNSPVARKGKQRVLRRMSRGSEATDAEETASSAPIPPKPESTSGSAPTDEESSDEKPSEKELPEEDPPKEEPPEERSPDAKSTSPETTATKAVSELEQLRRQVETEAKQEDVRPGRRDAPESSEEETLPSTPEERVDRIEENDEDLDHLIDELESARIEPTPEREDVPAPDLESKVDDLVSETLARIHEAQDQYRKAAQIYVKLASQEPDQAREYLEQAAEMRRRAEQNASEDDA